MTANGPGDPAGLSELFLDRSATAALGQAPSPDPRAPRSWRRLLEWSSTSAPVALLLLAGLAFGPNGMNLLSVNVLSPLDRVVPVALAALGVLVGLSVGDRRMDPPRVFVAASLAAALTGLVVSAGIAMVALATTVPFVRPFWTLTVGAGICAATSLTLPTGNPLEPRSATTRLIELGVLLPIVAGGFALAWLRTYPVMGAVSLAQAAGVTLALAAAAWLLLTQASSEMEERVLAVSALLLVGGAANALSVSALFAGLAAGVFWRYGGKHPRDTISRDVLFVQHPLLVLVLLVAGARADLSAASLRLGAVYLVLRVVGRLIGGMAARRAAGVNVPRELELSLLPPGVFGVAFALNAASIVGTDASILLAAVVAGTIGSEFVALLPSPRKVEA
jgi:hypothetical protein